MYLGDLDVQLQGVPSYNSYSSNPDAERHNQDSLDGLSAWRKQRKDISEQD